MPSKPSKQKKKKAIKKERIKIKKESFIPPMEILKSVNAYNQGVKNSEKIQIHVTDCLNKACTIIGTYSKNPNNVSIRPSYSKKMPNFEKIKAVIVINTCCGITHTFAGAGGLVPIIPVDKAD